MFQTYNVQSYSNQSVCESEILFHFVWILFLLVYNLSKYH